MTQFENIEDLLGHEDLGTTAWHLIDQQRIDAFAQTSGDHQWIHTDPQRASTEGPFGGTIAHGALTLALCTTFLAELVQVRTVSHVVNIGFDRVRFRAPVPANSHLRGKARLLTARRLAQGARVTVLITAELKGSTKPACLAEQVLAFYG